MSCLYILEVTLLVALFENILFNYILTEFQKSAQKLAAWNKSHVCLFFTPCINANLLLFMQIFIANA